jgi:hypothetical protein
MSLQKLYKSKAKVVICVDINQCELYGKLPGK